MYTLTVTLKGTRHQIVLGFETEAKMKEATRPGMSFGGRVTMRDDFGQTASWEEKDAVGIVTHDPETHWKLRNALSVIALRAESNYRLVLEQDLSLRPYVGAVHPKFGSR